MEAPRIAKTEKVFGIRIWYYALCIRFIGTVQHKCYEFYAVFVKFSHKKLPIYREMILVICNTLMHLTCSYLLLVCDFFRSEPHRNAASASLLARYELIHVSIDEIKIASLKGLKDRVPDLSERNAGIGVTLHTWFTFAL